MIQNGIGTNSGTDSENYPVQQVSYKGNVINAVKLLPYPLVGNPPNDAETVLLNINGQEENKASLSHIPTRRLKGFKPCEGGIQNVSTGNYVVMLNDGTTHIYTKTDLIADITENIIAKFKQMALTGDTITITANVNITGDIDTTGSITNNGKAIDSTHTHGGVQTGGGNTAVPN